MTCNKISKQIRIMYFDDKCLVVNLHYTYVKDDFSLYLDKIFKKI